MTRWAKLKAGVEAWSPRTWPITILIAASILGVTLYNLYLLQSTNRPQLVSTGAQLSINRNANPPEYVSVNWGNMGKRSAHRGTAILYTITEDGNGQLVRLGTSEIANNGNTTMVPTFGYASARVTIDMSKFLGAFLVCTKYYDDDDNPYKQEFPFKRADNQPNGTIQLIELPPSKRSHCESGL